MLDHIFSSFFFFNDTATTEIYTLSLHDALPISCWNISGTPPKASLTSNRSMSLMVRPDSFSADRKSTRLNSSHTVISYAVFCLKKKKNNLNCKMPCNRTMQRNHAASEHTSISVL